MGMVGEVAGSGVSGLGSSGLVLLAWESPGCQAPA